jgi:hypothetical protein
MMHLYLFALLLLPYAAGCSDEKPAPDYSCTSALGRCKSLAYSVCVDVAESKPGHCIDWSTVGATVCTSSAECSSSYPTNSLPTSGNGAVTECIKATITEIAGAGNANSGSGFCAATRTATDPYGRVTCMPNPCGENGYCSYTRAATGETSITCTWPT